MGGGQTQHIQPTPATPTRSDADTQALAAMQAKRYAAPGSFTQTMLAGSNGTNLGVPSGSGSKMLGG